MLMEFAEKKEDVHTSNAPASISSPIVLLHTYGSDLTE